MLTPFRRSASLCTATLLWVSALVPGCASRLAAPPPLQTLDLGSRRSPFRDYKGYNLCAQNSAQLAAELDDVNTLLADFLQSTSAGTQGVWANEHLALLTEGQKSLPPALGPLRATYQELRRCRLDPESGLPDIVRRGEELTRQSGTRLEEAQELLAFGEARQSIAHWEASLPSLREQGRAERCKKARTAPKAPIVFFATENFEGTPLWLFCDSVSVRGKASGSAEVIPPKKWKRQKRDEWKQPYLEAAARFPASDVLRSPRLPEQPTEKHPEEPDDPLSDESVID